MKKVHHPQMTDKAKFVKKPHEKKATDKNSTDKDTVDKKYVKHGSATPGASKKRVLKVSGGKVSSYDPAFKGAFPKAERRELKAKYKG